MPNICKDWNRIEVYLSTAPKGPEEKYNAHCTNHSVGMWSQHASTLEEMHQKVEKHLEERHGFPFLGDDAVWYHSVGQKFVRYFKDKKNNRG